MKKRIIEELSAFMPKLMREIAKRRSTALTKGIITVPQMILMEILHERRKCIMSDLAKDIGVTTSAITGTTDRLLRLKLIARKRGIRDRRIVSITLTQKGKNLVKKLLIQRKQMIKKMFQSGQVAIAFGIESILYCFVCSCSIVNMYGLFYF